MHLPVLVWVSVHTTHSSLIYYTYSSLFVCYKTVQTRWVSHPGHVEHLVIILFMSCHPYHQQQGGWMHYLIGAAKHSTKVPRNKSGLGHWGLLKLPGTQVRDVEVAFKNAWRPSQRDEKDYSAQRLYRATPLRDHNCNYIYHHSRKIITPVQKCQGCDSFDASG